MTDADKLTPPTLLADIGATNARFATVSGTQQRTVVLATADYADSRSLFSAACTALEAESVGGCCIAIAGPVRGGEGQITNGQLRFSEAALSAQLHARVLLVNDFHALAMALPALRSVQQFGGDADSRGPRVVLGPGSGLGVAFTVPQGNGWTVLPSEAGHADLAPGNMLELEVLSLLHQRDDRVCWESVLSGPGLVNLYTAVSAIWGGKAEDLTPEQISELGRDAQDPVCHHTLELFFGWLGAVAGNLALTLCARGGVYIGGGIVPGLVDLVAASPMRRRFEERAGLEDYVRDIPIYLITDEYPGLVGALACLQQSADDA